MLPKGLQTNSRTCAAQTVIDFPDRRTEVFLAAVNAVVHDMSDEDLDVLQNDSVGVFAFPALPSILAEHFRDWNNDYGRGEIGLSHENIHETYAGFYEHIVENPEDWENTQVNIARAALLGNGTPQGVLIR